MLHDFDDVNRILVEMRDEGLVEPVDDGSLQTDFYDWADVVGILDEIEPETTFSWRKALSLKNLGRGRAARRDVSTYAIRLYSKIIFLKIFRLTRR